MDYDEVLADLLEEEKKYRFNEFTSETALALGNEIIKLAKKEDAERISVDICAFGRQIFHYSNSACGVCNDVWLKRKSNTVMFCAHSSLYACYFLEKTGDTVVSKWMLNPNEYAQIGGGFPIQTKTGDDVIGTVAFSGLPHEKDHVLVVQAIKNFIFG